MPSDTIPFPKDIKPTTPDIGLSDAQIAEKIHLAVALMQEAMDAALMAGPTLPPWATVPARSPSACAHAAPSRS